ncbi:MAG TPA: TonB-dependent receptor [Vicinamibacterales bacterium]
MRTRTLVLFFCFHLFFSLPARAQDTIAVSGRITDASGAVVPGATIDVVVADRRVATANSGADGSYRVNVPARVPIRVSISLAGFAEQTFSNAGSERDVTRDVVMVVAGLSDTLVVTAARTPVSATTVTESVTSFSQHDIEALGSSSLADIIRFVPAVNVESTGRDGAVASMFSRGGESDYNLVLIDGVRANQSGGIFDFSRISAADIDRVEVVRGAQSALWGSDAMGSVVQVFSRRATAAQAPELNASAEAGTFGTFRGHTFVNGGAGRAFDYHAGVSHRQTSGAFSDLLTEDDTFDQNAVDVSAGAMIGRRGTIRGSVRYTAAKGRTPGQITFGARDTGTEYETRDLTGYLSVSHAIGSRVTGSATVNAFNYESRSVDTAADPFSVYTILTGTPNALFPNGTRLVRLIDVAEFNTLVAAGAMPAPGQFLASRQVSDFPFTSVTEFERPAFRYQADFTAGAARTSAGYEWERERNPAVNGFTLNNHAAFIQQHVSIGERVFVTAGARFDSKDTYDTFVSPKLSIGGFVVPFRRGRVSSVKVFGNIGRGIKSPTFSERLGSAFSDPNPSLEVERARTGDAGIEATFADQRFFARATYFDNDYIDQIAFRSGLAGDGIPEYINIDGSKANGWELEWALQRPIAGLSAAASYAHVDHRVVTNLSTSQQFQPGQPLLRRPRNAGSLRASFVRGPVTLNADARIVGDRHDHSFLSLRTVPNAQMPSAITTDITFNPGYTVFGGGVDVRAHDRVTLFLRGNNIGDAAYDSVLGYPGLPRAFVAGARVRFGASR